MRTAVFINIGSRQTRKVQKRIRYDLEKSQLNIVEVITVGPRRRFSTGVRRLKQLKRLNCVIIAGGDGTIAGVLNEIKLRADLTIGLLPLGTGNSFARSLGVPLTYEEALAVIMAGQSRATALGAINGRLFINAAAIGLSATTASQISDTTKRYFGRLAYLLSGSRQLLTHRSFRCIIRTAGETHEFDTHELLIVNGAYYGSRRVDHHTSVYKDYLTFVALGTDESRIRYALNHIRLLWGKRSKEDQHIFSISAQKATITTCPRRRIHADGEVISRTPAEVKIRPKAVYVFTPKAKLQR